jgi:hypothetical protein
MSQLYSLKFDLSPTLSSRERGLSSLIFCCSSLSSLEREVGRERFLVSEAKFYYI